MPPSRELGTQPKESLIELAGFLALFLFLWGALSLKGEPYDWDTCERAGFLSIYDWSSRPSVPDAHMLYHFIGYHLVHLSGFRTLTILDAETAFFFSLFAGVIYRIARRKLGDVRSAGGVTLIAVLASPGLVGLLLIVEDNVAYFPFLAAFFSIAFRATTSRAPSIRGGLLAGALLAVALHLNATLLVLLFAGVAASYFYARGRAHDALKLALSTVSAFVFYFPIQLLYPRQPNALLFYLKMALSRDQTHLEHQTGLFEWQRVVDIGRGLYAIAINPTQFVTSPPALAKLVMVGIVPCVLAVCVAVFVWQVRARFSFRSGGLSLPFLGLALALPVLYESWQIERWDVLWIALLVLLLENIDRIRPSLRHSSARTFIAVEILATVFLLLNVYGKVFYSDTEWRKTLPPIYERREM